MKTLAGPSLAVAGARPTRWSAARWSADRADGLHAAIAQLLAACARYADDYARLRRQPVGCDAERGPILLEVLRGVAALAGSEAARDAVGALISDHALDLEE